MKKLYLLITAFFMATVSLHAQDPGLINLIPSGNFEGITSVQDEGWALLNGDASLMELVVSDNTLDASSTQMLKMVTPTTATNAWDLQLRVPDISLVPGSKYVLKFDIRSDGEGQGRISAGNNQINQQYWPDFNTTEEWQTMSFATVYGDSITAIGETLSLTFDLGYVADMVYYLDNVRWHRVYNNLVATGDFEGITSVQDEGWALLNGDASLMELVDSDNDLDPTSTKVLKMVTPTTATNAWDLQLRVPDITLVPGSKYVLMFDIRSDGEGQGRISAGNNQINQQYWPDFNTTEEWQTFSFATVYGDSITAVGETLSLTFDLGYVADMVYYLDNVKLYKVTEVDPDPEYVNLIPSGTFEDITSVQDEGWALLNGDASLMELVDSDNDLDPTSTKVLKMVTPATATNAWDLQLRAPDVTIVPGYQYVLMFDIRSDGDGQGRISAANNQISPQYWPDFNTTEEWQTFKFDTINGSVITAVGETLSITFDLGYVADMVYYLDNVILYEIEVEIDDPDPEYVNLIPTGDFEDITSVQDEGWALLNGDASLMELVVSDNTLDASSTQMLKMVTPATATNAWDLQLRAPDVTIVPGYQYVLMFDIRSEGDGQGRISAADNQISPQYWPDFDTTEEWQTFKFDTINGSAITAVGETLSLTFDLGYVADMVYYLDNVILYEIEVEIDDTNVAPIEAQLSANVYPNPATNYLVVQMNNLHRAEVWDMTGKLIYSVAGNGLEVNLDISNLNTGIYFVRAIDSNNNAVVRKVIKN